MTRLATTFEQFGRGRFTGVQLLYAMSFLATTLTATFLVWPGLAHRLMASDFLPHLYCYLGKPGLVWTHVGTDSLIALAYFTISGTLVYLVHKGGRDIPFPWMFLAFGLFIVACGATHLMEVITVWSPVYILSASVKVVTALASVATAVLLPFTVPHILALIETAKASEVAEGKFRGLLEAAPDAMVIANETGKIVLVNSQAEKLFGYPREELLGNPVDRLIPDRFHEQHAAQRERFSRDPHGRPIEAGLQLYARRNNGDEFPVEISLSPLRTMDGILVTAAIRDITERRRIEDGLRRSELEAKARAEELAAIMDAMPGMALMARDPSCHQLTGSRASYQMLRLAYGVNISKSAPDGPSNFRILRDGRELCPHELPLQQAAASAREVRDSEITIQFDDGASRQVLGNAAPLLDQQGEVRGAVGVFVDITERKRAEEALRESEERLRLATEAGKMFAYEWDAATDVIQRSPEFERILGSDGAARTTGRQIWSQVHPDDRERLAAALSELSPSKPRLQISYRVVRSDGTVIWVDRNSRAHFDKQGGVRRIVGMIADITERKRTEQALRDSEDRYRDLVEHSEDLLCTHDLEGKLLSCNPAPARILGYEVAELLKIPLRELIAPEYRKQFDEYLHRMKTKSADKGLMTVITRKGEHRIWEYDNTLRTEGVALPIVRGMAHNVTERKRAEMALRRSEENYRLFVAQSSEGIFRQDLDTPIPVDLPEDELVHHILYDSYLANCNDALARMYGLNSAQEFIGKRLIENLDPTDPRNIELTREYVRTGFRVLERESHEVNVRGEPKIFLNSLIGIVEGGKLLRTWGIQRDVTERKRAEQALQKAQAELTRVARIATLGELTASIAHEINQPLGAVVTSANAALRWLDANPPNLDEAREAIAQTVEQADLASQVIKKTRLMLQKAPPERRALEINDIIREALALSNNELLRSGVKVHTQIAADLPAVLGDRVQLQQVMLNLILNAIEAMSTVNGRPRMLWVKSARQGEDVEIHVQDSGIGLKPEELERIFDPFVTSKAEGIGMGLSIGRSIVAAHGGRLWATPGSPYGALFQFLLPAERAA